MRDFIRRAAFVPLVVLLAACRNGSAATTRDTMPTVSPVAVRTVDVRHEAIAEPVTATGVIASKEEIPLGFKIGGVVAEVLVHEGETVRAGQTLATLDLREIDAMVTKARSSAAKAERDLARIRRLYAESVATLQQFEDATTGVEVARADLDATNMNRRYAAIIAPASGVILRRGVEPGQLVAVGTPVVVFGNTSSGTVFRAALSDRDVVRVALGAAAIVRVDAWPDRELRGAVRQISRAADPRTGTYTVEVAISAPSGLSSGMVGRTEIVPQGTARLPVVPVEALVEGDGDRAAVFALGADGHAKRVEVRVAFVQAGRAAIRDGLAGVTRVVVDGAAYLNDGSTVRVVP
jgi:membrane fusion protein, multidrug efflux system